MKTALIIFMILAGVICLFSLIVVISDIARGRKAAAAQVKEEEPEKEPAPAAEPVPATAAPAAPAAAYAPSATAFLPAEGASCVTGLEDITDPEERKKAYREELMRYASEQRGAKLKKRRGYREYRSGRVLLLRLGDGDGAPLCAFELRETDFRVIPSEAANLVRLHEANFTLRVEDDVTFMLAKNCIDMAARTAEINR